MIATGAFHKPYLPEFRNTLSDDVLQLHSSQYKNSKQLRNGPVLVVGGGNSVLKLRLNYQKLEKHICQLVIKLSLYHKI